LAIWRLTEFLSAIVLCRTLGIFIIFSAKIPPHRQAEKRYAALKKATNKHRN
jgi:hypothetical protein